MKPTLTAWLATLAGVAQAHPGHGLPGQGLSGTSHWHGSDALLWLGGLAVVVAGLWLNRRK